MAPNFHVRSVSLPSGSHPLAASVEKQLCKLRGSQETSTSTSSSSAICHKLDGLKKLYECVDDLLQLNECQQHLSDESLEETLNGSIRILDVCDISRDVLSKLKECVQELESSLRRRIGGDNEVVDAYMTSRKKISKIVYKSLKTLKRSEIKSVDSNKDSTIKLLKESEEVSLSVFESLLSLVSQPKNNNGWSSVSKLFKPKRISCKSLLMQSEDLNSNIQELEQNLERLYRRLVKTRVTLLNILNN
ncbi:hypothetical protein ACFE04_012066 [Oxalis oulophora]